MSTLTWKPLSHGDTDMIFRSCTGNVAEYFYAFKNQDEAQAWIDDAIKAHEPGSKLEYVIYDGGEFIGMISLRYVTKTKVDIGMWVREEMQGKGYGKQILFEMLEQIANTSVTEVVYETEVTNEPSIRLAESLGFLGTNEGDIVRFTKNLLV